MVDRRGVVRPSTALALQLGRPEQQRQPDRWRASGGADEGSDGEDLELPAAMRDALVVGARATLHPYDPSLGRTILS